MVRPIRQIPATFMDTFLPFLRRSLKGLFILLPVLIGLMVNAPADAARWDAETLTVPVNPDGGLVTFSEQEINTGRKVFSNCGTMPVASPRPTTTWTRP